MTLNPDTSKLLFFISGLVIGAILTYLRSIWLTTRKEQLELIHKQLDEFFGPLYIATLSSKVAMNESIKSNNGAVFKNENHPTKEEIENWKNWMINVLMPINQTIENLILTKAHVIYKKNIPRELIDFLAHISAYKVIIANWESNGSNIYLANERFPKYILDYAESEFNKLKEKQLQIIGKRKLV